MSDFGTSAHAARTPDKPALVLGDDVRTYRQLDERSTRLAHALRGRGVGERSVVAAMLPNGFEFVEVGVATSKVGALFLPVNWHLKRDELSWILRDAGAAVLVAHESLGDVLSEAPCPVVLVGDSGGRGDYEAVLASPEAEGPAVEGAAAWAPVFYTSGTTGRPKGVVHGYLDAERVALGQHGQVALWGWTPDDVYLMAGPAYHAAHGGWTMTALFVGATTVILPRWEAREFLRLVERHRVTRTFMVPAHFIRLLELPEEERAAFDSSSLRLVVHAAAPCPVEVKRRMMNAFPHVDIWELYGASEGGATRIGPDEWRQRPGSVGTPWPGIEVKVLSEDGEELPTGQDGLIYITGMQGQRFEYHNDPEKTSSAWRDRFYTVGDVGHLDEDGYLYITDRASDMVIRGGVNVYPREVEEVLHRHRAVVDCAVFGVPDERYGEQLKAVVEARGATVEELAEFCREHLAAFKVPAHWELVDTLPRDPNGKVMKRFLRERHWEGRATRV